MARLKLRLPREENYLATFRYKLRIDDMNYGGHLSNDRVLGLCHDARLEMLKMRGMSEMNCMERGLVMNESQVVYRAEGFQGDDLQIHIYLGETTRYGFELYYKLIKEGATEIARVKTGQVFFDLKQRQIFPLNDNQNDNQTRDHFVQLFLGQAC